MGARARVAGMLYPLTLTALVVPLGTIRDEPTVRIDVLQGQRIDFRTRTGLVARYHIAGSVAKPYFWPLYAPGSVALTRPWPMEQASGEDQDHIHQKSAWFGHGDVIPEGLTLRHHIKGVQGVDFWSENPGHGRIVCTSVGQPHQEGRHAWVRTTNEWRTADNETILNEARTIHLHDFGTARLLVLDIDLCASAVPVTFGDTKEGTLGVRVRTRMTEKKGKGQITNAEGKVGSGGALNLQKKGCWGLISAWCDYSAPIDGATAGIAILADPSNPYPTAWHSRDYGLMAANPFGRARSGFPDLRGQTRLVHLARGEHLKLRYGLLLHTGNAQQAGVASYYDRFVRLRGSKQ